MSIVIALRMLSGMLTFYRLFPYLFSKLNVICKYKFELQVFGDQTSQKIQGLQFVSYLIVYTNISCFNSRSSYVWMLDGMA